jgi:acyl-CoA synthetase (AMP-forming)/AMP-acid ligase II
MAAQGDRVRDRPLAWTDPWGAEPPPADTMAGLLAWAAATHGDREAFVDGAQRVTHAQVHDRARQVARALLAHGAGKGTRVAVLMGNRVEWVAAAFGAWMAGAVVVPVNTYSPPDEREYVLRHSDAAILLMQPSLRRHAYLDDLLAAHPSLPVAALPRLRAAACLDLDAPRGQVQPWRDFLDAGRDFPDDVLDAAIEVVHPEDDAVVIYTSGTSARPKGVLHAQRAPAVQSFRWAALQRFGADERIWTTMPFFWSAGLCKGLGTAIAAGACMVTTQWFDPEEALALIERERVTTVICRAHQEAALAEHPDAARRDLRSLRRSRPASPLRRFGDPQWDDFERGGAYGLTEMCTLVTSCPADAPLELRTGTHGRPFPGTVLRIVDPATGEPLPPGVEGEIAVGGLTAMRGYHKRRREEVFDTQGLFRTGDGGWLDADGWLHWLGRRTGMIKTAGANVSPVEIEQELARWGRLRLAVALGVPDERLGEAVVVAAMQLTDQPVSGEEVREYLRSRLASYKVPRAVLFFGEDDVEFTGSDKVRPESVRAFALAQLQDMEART